jgi:response regulator NasT
MPSTLGQGKSGPRSLRVLLGHGGDERHAGLASVIAGLGHEVVVGTEVGASGREMPDIALVVAGAGSPPAAGLALIDAIATEAACPVIVVLDAPDPAFVGDACKRGAFAAVTNPSPGALQCALDAAMERFSMYHGLKGAAARRATIECAKGILMERHRLDRDAAFAQLRDEARRSNRKLVEIATAVVDGHGLLSAGS